MLAPTQDLVFELDGAAFRGFVGTARRLGGQTPGPAVWTFDETSLRITWRGMSRRLDGSKLRGDSGVWRVDGSRSMRALADAAAPVGPVEVNVSDGWLRIGDHSQPVTRLPRDPGICLPLRATPLDVLIARRQHDPVTFELAGLGDALDDAEATIARAFESACEALPWLRLDAVKLRALIEPHILSLAGMEPASSLATDQPDGASPVTRTIVIEPSGQVGLFGIDT